MDLSKMRARMKMRKVAGQDVARQDRSSKAFAKAQAEAKNAPYAGESGVDVEGNKPRPRLDRPARASGGRVCRAEGGPTISEESKAKAKELREKDSGTPGLNGGAMGVGVGTYLAHKDRYLPKTTRVLGKTAGAALAGLGALGVAADISKRHSDRSEADRIERGQAEPGKEDRKRGGRVAKDKDCD